MKQLLLLVCIVLALSATGCWIDDLLGTTPTATPSQTIDDGTVSRGVDCTDETIPDCARILTIRKSWAGR